LPRSLKTILDAILDGIVVLDAQGRVEQLNSEACRILETSEASALGRPLEKLFGPDHPIAQLSRTVQQSGRSAIEDDVTFERRFAGSLVADAAVAPLFEEHGEIGGSVIVLGDRTIRNSLRDALSQREALASYGHIAAGIAHEVKNPLSGIRGAAELLELRAGDDRARKTAHLIVREVDRITALVDELMVFARGEQLDLCPTNLHRILDQVLELVAMDPKNKRVSVKRVYDPSIPELMADESRLTQVFLNLARNALQAMETTGGTLTVTTGVSVDHHVAGRDGRRLPAVNIAFRDEGVGVSKEDLQRLATPFFTTKPEGTGLGLAVARHWVLLHDGTLDIDSSLGCGTVARVALPLREPPRAE
jgi:two-component system nitrogen regulation sensor histidine kinase GlnL